MSVARTHGFAGFNISFDICSNLAGYDERGVARLVLGGRYSAGFRKNLVTLVSVLNIRLPFNCIGQYVFKIFGCLLNCINQDERRNFSPPHADPPPPQCSQQVKIKE